MLMLLTMLVATYESVDPMDCSSASVKPEAISSSFADAVDLGELAGDFRIRTISCSKRGVCFIMYVYGIMYSTVRVYF